MNSSTSKKDIKSKKKRPRVPTRNEKQLMKENRLDWHNWLIGNEDNISITCISKASGKRRVIFK